MGHQTWPTFKQTTHASYGASSFCRFLGSGILHRRCCCGPRMRPRVKRATVQVFASLSKRVLDRRNPSGRWGFFFSSSKLAGWSWLELCTLLPATVVGRTLKRVGLCRHDSVDTTLSVERGVSTKFHLQILKELDTLFFAIPKDSC